MKKNKDSGLTKYDKIIKWSHNNKLILSFIILFAVLIFIKTAIQNVDFVISWVSDAKESLFPQSFDKSKNTLNILLVHFDRIEKDLNSDLKIEQAIYNRFYDLVDKYKADLQIISDKKNSPNNYEEAEKMAKKKGAKIIIFGKYYENSSQAEIKYIYLTKEFSPLLLNDSTVSFEGILEPGDSILQLTSKNSTGIIKFNNLAEISDLSNIKLLKNIDRLIYSLITLKKFEDKKYYECYEFTNIIPLWNDERDFGIFYIQLKCLVSLKDYKKMLDLCNRIIKLKPDNPSSYFNRAGCYIQLNDTNEALKDYFKCIEFDPNYVKAFVKLGEVYLSMKNYKLAYNNFTKAIELDSKDTNSFFNRGKVLIEMKKYDDAIKDFSVAVIINNKMSNAYVNRGVCERRIGKYDEALNDFNKSINLDSNNILAYFNRGCLYFSNIKSITDAIKDFSTVLEKDNNFFNAHLLRYYCYTELQNGDKQIEELIELIRLDSNNVEFYNAKGYNYLVKGQYEKSIIDFNKAISLNKDYSLAYNNRGWAYANLKDFEKALENFSISSKLYPNNPYLFTFRGLTYFRMKRYKESLRDLNLALLKNKEYHDTIIKAINDIKNESY